CRGRQRQPKAFLLRVLPPGLALRAGPRGAQAAASPSGFTALRQAKASATAPPRMTALPLGAPRGLEVLCPPPPRTREERAGNLYRCPRFRFSKWGEEGRARRLWAGEQTMRAVRHDEPTPEVRAVPPSSLGERYRRYRLADPQAEQAMTESLRRWGQLG